MNNKQLLKNIIVRAIEAESIPLPDIWKSNVERLVYNVVDKLLGAHNFNPQQPLSREALEAIFDKCGGPQKWMIEFGYIQFARAVEESHNIGIE
jgi:hypothetical protein